MMNTSYPAPVKGWFAQNRGVSVPSGLLAVVLILPVFFALWLVVKPGGASALMWFDDSMLFGLASVAAMATFAAARRYAGTPTGRAWALISLGMVFIAFGEGAWGFQEAILGQDVNSPAVADIGYLAFYVPVFLGLLSMPQAPLSGRGRVQLTLDVGIPMGAIALISSKYLIAGLLTNSDGFGLGEAIGVAYPILDLTLVFAAIVLIVRGGRTLSSASVAILAAGLVCIAFSDSIYAYLSQLSNYDSGNYFDIGWAVGYTLIAVAGMTAAGRQLNFDSFSEDRARPLPLWQMVTLHLPLLPVMVILFLHPSGSQLNVDIVMLACFMVLVVLTFARQVLLGLDYRKNYRETEELTASLQDRVRVQQMRNLHSGPPDANAR
jgi:diguanylate cyclase